MELLPSKFNLVLVIKSCLRPWGSSFIFLKENKNKVDFYHGPRRYDGPWSTHGNCHRHLFSHLKVREVS
jgi:hypothetical protein